MLIPRLLLVKHFSRLLIRDKLADFLRQICRFKLLTHLSTQLETLSEVKHVHVIEDLLLLVLHDTESDCIEAFFVHAALELDHFTMVHD